MLGLLFGKYFTILMLRLLLMILMKLYLKGGKKVILNELGHTAFTS